MNTTGPCIVSDAISKTGSFFIKAIQKENIWTTITKTQDS